MNHLPIHFTFCGCIATGEGEYVIAPLRRSAAAFLRSAAPDSLAGAKFNFAFFDCIAVGGGEYKLVPRKPRKMVPISYAAKVKGISVQTIHNYIVADFLKFVERPTPFKWLIDLGELDALLAQSTDTEFWTPERTAAYLKAKRGHRTPANVPASSTKKPKAKAKRTPFYAEPIPSKGRHL